MESNDFSYSAPYPPVQVEGKNPRYARMILSNLGGYVSEMSAVGLYLYNHFVSIEDSDFSETFLHIAIVEMHHFDIFGQTAYLLGADPRLWKNTKAGMCCWSPDYLNYYHDHRKILENALAEELEAIQKYRCQMEIIKDQYIVANLRRIIEDEEVHVKIFRRLLSQLDTKLV